MAERDLLPEARPQGIDKIIASIRSTEELSPSRAIELGTEVAQQVEEDGDLEGPSKALEAYHLLREKLEVMEPKELVYLEPSLRSWELRAEALLSGQVEELPDSKVYMDERISKQVEPLLLEDELVRTYWRYANRILEEDPEAYEQAAYFLSQAQMRALYLQTSRFLLRKIRFPVALWNLVWLTLAIFGLIFALPVANWLAAQLGLTQAPGQVRIIQSLISSALMGAAGGAIGALYRLFQSQGLEEIYVLYSFYTRPILGLLIGVLTLLVVNYSIALALPETYTAQNTPGSELGDLILRLSALLAFLVSFSDRLFQALSSQANKFFEERPETKMKGEEVGNGESMIKRSDS